MRKLQFKVVIKWFGIKISQIINNIWSSVLIKKHKIKKIAKILVVKITKI